MTGGDMERMQPGDNGVETMLYSGINQITTSGATTIYANNSNTITLTVNPGSCSDGMSDIVYSGQVIVLLSGSIFTGCVR